MFVGALRAEYLVPGARSLKDKRKPLRSLKDRLHRRFKVAVAEVGAQDLLQRAVIAVSLVAPKEKKLRGQMEAVRRYLENNPELQLLNLQERVFGNLDPEAGGWGLPEDLFATPDRRSREAKGAETLPRETL